MTQSQSEIDNQAEQEGYPPYTDAVDAGHDHHEIFSSFGNEHNPHGNYAGVEHKDNDEKNNGFSGKSKQSTMRDVFNPQAMAMQEQIQGLTVIYVDLGGDIGSVPISGASPEEAQANATAIQKTMQDGKEAMEQGDPSLHNAITSNLELASRNVNGHINATYKDQFADESEFGTECRIDTSAEAVLEATQNPNSYAADNFAMLKGETTPSMSASMDI